MKYLISLGLITSLLLQSCSFRTNRWGRNPSSEANYDSLKNQMAAFKNKIMGSEHDSKCSPEQIDADFEKLISSLKKDSCSKSDYNLDKEEFTRQSCPKIKTDGIFDRVVKETIKAEKSNKKDNPVYSSNKEILQLYKEAVNFKYMLKGLFANNQLSPEEAVDLTSTYIENILLPIRDMIVITRSYLTNEFSGNIYIKNLQMQLPDALIQELNSDQINILTQGPDPMSAPFYLELIPSTDGESQTLSFSPSDIIRRDVVTLLKAPTSKNYVLSLKWMTLHMMLSQVYLYNTILGNKGNITIPNSCQNHFNGSLPPELKFKVEQGVGDKFLENILSGHGLTFKEDDSSYIDYYIDNINRDPTKDGYSGLIPFENYKNAKLKVTGKVKGSLDAQLDDVAHYQAVVNLKMQEMENVYRGRIKNKNITFAGHDNFQKMMGSFSADEIAEIPIGNNESQSIYSGKQNLSPYLLDLMKEKKVIDYSGIMPKSVKNQLNSNQVRLEFPSMYSSPAWRDWSLKVLADLLYKYEDLPGDTDLHRIINNYCLSQGSIFGHSFQGICSSGNKLKNLSSQLAEFRSGEKYIPTRRLEEKNFQAIYPLLRTIWNSLRDRTNLLEEAKLSELNFLEDQMSAGNPWARLRISYLVMVDELNNSKRDNKVQCDKKIVETELDKIKSIGKILGLDRPLTNNHAEQILTSDEKRQVWSSVVDDIDHRNAQLFTVKNGSSDYYKMTEDVSYKTILTPEAALGAGVSLSKKTQSEIKNIGKSNEAQIAEFFLKLYSLKGNIPKQQELFEKFSAANGIDNTFNLKLSFLALDESYKKPIYKDLLKQAASTRRYQILKELDEFCGMDINDHKSFKNIFYSTTKAQNELNQMAGLASIPPEVTNKLGEMSPDEFRDMWWGIGSGVAGMAAIVVGGACTALSGGICAPLGGAMAVMGMTSLGIQVKLTTNEFQRKLEANGFEQKIKTMEDLGFANVGSSDEVHRSYAWTAFEAISIFPMIGIASRSLAIGPKLAYVSTKSLLHQTGKESFKAVAKGAVQEEEVRLASYVLGIDSISQNIGIEAAARRISKIKTLYTTGAIDFETMLKRTAKILSPIRNAKITSAKMLKKELGTVIVRKSALQIDKQTSEVITNYFGDNPKEMYRLIHSYSGEKLNKAIAVMKELNSTNRIGRRIPIYSGTKDWFLRMRNESLAKNAEKIWRIEKELNSLGTSKGKLEKFITKNMEDLTDIFIDIPMRKRELPYMIQIQGLPEFSFLGGRKIPLLSMMSEGQTMKKFFNARARLVYESYKSQARFSLKLKRYVQAESTLGAFKAFQLSIADLANTNSQSESLKIISRYNNLEDKMGQRLFKQYVQSGNKMDYKIFKQVVFSPKNLHEEATSQAIWESIPADQLLGMKEAGELAHQAVQELATYTDVDSFTRYLSALKVLVINRNPAVLDLM